MKKNLLAASLFALIMFSALWSLGVKTVLAAAQDDIQSLKNKLGDGFTYSVDESTGKLSFISGEGKNLPFNVKKLAKLTPQKVGKQFLKEYGKYFGVSNPGKNLVEAGQEKDDLEITHLLYGQRFRGVKVFGSEILLHVDKENAIGSAAGRLVPDIKLNVRPKVAQGEAEKIARGMWKDQFHTEEADTVKIERIIFNEGIINNKEDGRSYLAWKVDLANKKILQHEIYFINARNGKKIFQLTGKFSLNRKVYDCSLGGCVMDYLYLGYTYGRSEGKVARGANPWFGGQDVDNLYDSIGYMSNFLTSKFSRNGANKHGGVGDGSSNPLADTEGLTYVDYAVADFCPNACFDPSLSDFWFCQGYTVTDVIGHEYAHAVNYYSVLDGSGNPSGLIYYGESGALNESHSDVMGEALEYYHEGSNDWLSGQDLPGGANRSLSNPGSKSYSSGKTYPDMFDSPMFYCGSGDSGGVHINSTVPSHAAYLMAMGGSFNGCSVSAIGRAKEEKIAYRAYDMYMTTSSNFNAAYNAFIDACGTMYGYGSSTCVQVKKALQAAQMNRSGACNGDALAVSPCAAPVVSGIEEGITYGSAVTPTFSHGTATLNGASFTSGTEVSTNGDYILVATNSFGDSTTVQFAVKLISSDTTTLTYTRKKSATKKMNVTVSGVSLSKKKGVNVRLGGRKVSVTGVRNLGDSTRLSLKVKYGRWPVGSYNFSMTYRQKVNGAWQSGSSSADGMLNIVNP